MVVRWLFAVEKDVTGLVRSKQALQAAIRGGGRVVLVVNTRSRKGRRHWPGLSARLAAAGLLAHRDTALGVLPLGTTNNFARSLGLPLDVGGAVAALAAGKVADVDLARAGEDLFTNMASIGLSVEVAQAVPHRLKRVLGRGAYTLTAARRLASHQAFKATLRVDGAEQVVWTHQLNVANGGYHAGRRIARDAGVDDRLLVVYRLGDAGRLQVTGQTVRQVVVGPRRPLADGPYVMTREVWVDTDPALALDLDG